MATFPKVLHVMEKHCATCPFHAAGWTHVRELLTSRAMQAAPICHSTGSRALKKGKDWIKQAHVCRGARNLQLDMMFRLGVIKAPTDAAWAEKVNEMVLNSHASNGGR